MRPHAHLVPLLLLAVSCGRARIPVWLESDELASPDAGADADAADADAGAPLPDAASDAALDASADAADTAPPVAAFGEPCRAQAACASRLCVVPAPGEGRCSQRCTLGEVAACPEGWSCVMADLGGADRTVLSLCWPGASTLCRPCGSDDECGGGGRPCLVNPGGAFCAWPCTAPEECPEGYACEDQPALSGPQCVPVRGGCCADGSPGVAETCNDEDDDCDGRTDEDFPLGEECAAGDGICARMGHFLCSADGQGADCDAVPGLPGVELCGNGADDNCDGETDEGYDEGEPCSAGIGGCVREGQLVCTADGLDTECNAVPGAAVDELCGNGVDDDCDDETDEGFALGVGCAVGVGACLRTGSTICAEDGTDIGCDVEPGLPGDELCGNETDDDCNGDTDEGFDVGVACLSGVGSCARAGELVCSEDRLGTVCGAEEGSPSLEVCNELDDDCDGVTDDDCVPVVPVSCLDVLERRGEADSGAFEVDPDGDEGEGAILVYCDMETDGGGWTLFGNVISGGFDYDAFVHPWAGISEADTNKLGVKPADTRARMRVTGAGFHFDVSQTDPSAAFAPSGDDTWSRLVFDTVVDEAGASIRYGAHELLLSTTRTGNGCDIQGSTVRVSGAWASEIGGELYLGASGCGAGSPNYGLLWPIQELEGGTCPHSVRNTMEIGSQNVCDNDATGVFATRLQLFYR